MGVNNLPYYMQPVLQNPQPKTFQQNVQQASNAYYQPKPTVNVSTGGTRSVLGVGTNSIPSNPNPNPSTPPGPNPEDMLRQRENELSSQLEADYQQAIGLAGAAEENLRGQVGIAEGQITNEAAKTRTALGAEQGTKEQAVQQNLQTAEREGTSAMQQARDLFRQTQQSNIAQLSALGISSSSVAEALGERLGVETARRIAGVTGSIQEIRQNATAELGRIKNYYGERLTQLQTDEQLQKQQIQLSLVEGLKQINAQRQAAANEKAARRADLLSQINQQLYSLAQQKQTFEQQLKMWAEQKAAALTPIVQDPNYINNLIQQSQVLNQQFNPTGFAYTPELSYDKYGTVTGRISAQKKPVDEELANPFVMQ